MYRLHATPSLDQCIEKEHDSYLLGQLKYVWSGRNGEGREGGAVKGEGERGRCSEGRGGEREVQ